MPEFTYEESDNYMLAQEYAGYSDGRLKKEYFAILRALKAGNRDFNYRLSLDILETEMKKRGIMDEGHRVINKK